MPRAGEPKTSIRRINAADKQRQAVQARLAGATYESIAKQLGYANKSGAVKAVTTALRKTLQEPADDLRTLHFWRLEQSWSRLMPRILEGDTDAIRTGLLILQREAKLYGLDSPLKIDLRALVLSIAKRHDLNDDESRVLFDDLTAYLDEQRSGL